MYNLPADVKWPQQLGNVIRSYQMGQMIKQQREQEQAQMLLAAMKEQRESEKAAADIQMKQAYMALLKSLGGQGREEGPPTDESVLPGMGAPSARVSGWGPGGPRVEFEKPRTTEELVEAIANIAAKRKNMVEGSPEDKLAEKVLRTLEEQLAERQGMEIKETPEVFPKSVLGIDIPYTGSPAKRELVPKGSVSNLPAPAESALRNALPMADKWLGQPPQMSDLDYAGIRKPAARAKKGSFRSLGPTAEMLKGIYGAGKSLAKGRPAAKTMPQKPPAGPKGPMPNMNHPFVKGRPPAPEEALTWPPEPKDTSQKVYYDEVMRVWYSMPSELEYLIYMALDKGSTWKEIAETKEVAHYLK